MATVPVGSMPQCQSQEAAYAGVYDLAGNVWEWEDACRGTAGAGDACAFRGGDYTETGSSDLVCGPPAAGLRADTSDVSFKVGFRCCSDP